ncbi:MAG: hypothetical protein EKK47_16580 [Burkholderiales bacterium]|nr:MAG: hypothetical protein EKK47_16580 [Burkholderiales bacterium]
MPCPDAVAALVELVTAIRHELRHGDDEAEAMIAPGACLDCGGAFLYPFRGEAMPGSGMCRHCGRVELVARRLRSSLQAVRCIAALVHACTIAQRHTGKALPLLHSFFAKHRRREAARFAQTVVRRHEPRTD